jgi:hypothetical protein
MYGGSDFPRWKDRAPLKPPELLLEHVGHELLSAVEGPRETALMKLSFVLGHTDDHAEVLRMMRHSFSHEITDREPHNGYLILQGGLPETDEFVSSHWK